MPELVPPSVARSPQVRATLALALVLAFTATAGAQPKRRGAKPPKPNPAKPVPAAAPDGEEATAGGGGADKRTKTFDFTGMDIAGQMKTPQLFYFLDRATEELARASLERRSFIPEMVRSVEEESL